jgi:hypothetical protein
MKEYQESRDASREVSALDESGESDGPGSMPRSLACFSGSAV